MEAGKVIVIDQWWREDSDGRRASNKILKVYAW